MSDSSYEQRYYDLRDGQLSVIHYHANKGPIELVFAHANSFNGLTYKSIFEPLGIHAAVFDMRGQGGSWAMPTDPDNLKDWQIFADDITEFITRYTEQPVYLAGHSFGAASGILASSQLKGRLKGYMGFDPPVMPDFMRLSRFKFIRDFLSQKTPIIEAAGRRRSIFPDQDYMFDYYKERGMFKHMPRQVLRDFLEGGVKENADGVQLSCHPRWEQAVFTAQSHDLFRAAKSLPKNSHVIFAGVGSPTTHLSQLRVTRCGKARRVFHKDYHHLFPLNRPDVALNYLRELIG